MLPVHQAIPLTAELRVEVKLVIPTDAAAKFRLLERDLLVHRRYSPRQGEAEGIQGPAAVRRVAS